VEEPIASVATDVQVSTPVVVSSSLRINPIAQIEVATKKSWVDLAEKEKKWQQVYNKKKGLKSYKPAL